MVANSAEFRRWFVKPEDAFALRGRYARCRAKGKLRPYAT
jgi:hypothetical protein